ncbi:MAG: chemotaxis protein CheW [Hoeflea sp.]|uniref:chemotaxis protein CheW n=1 Tax=Hoeflea sp. TaxID=1940281 RepID=UPI001DF5596F|nr:chemotaxis protein CheW [Hoeflea sp.]MBU4531148.1 chemotaxis protein CheW [Alphaproteobacteria bacterium]MBU4545790.1 chemotaxis protein CheW [Alphaproteobacteria bacterium]MBU4550759.1 chemotaxis protein CheW [Alphaproteobacteria bacterium]MBV1724425.1 chemotaxis protein CheW [Hoeflea sp.]MBV1760445.1 chemotaxis protein CheW [Hoeflea sp.]
MRVSDNDMCELIAFTIGDQEFCVEVMAVREIRGWTPATPLPHSPGYVRGVINLRGVVLPVMDMSLRLGMEPTDPSERHVIIVIQIGKQFVGLLVDSVSDILTVPATDIQPPPDVSKEMDRDFVQGIIPIEGRMVCLIQLNALFGSIESEAA